MRFTDRTVDETGTLSREITAVDAAARPAAGGPPMDNADGASGKTDC